MRAPRKPKLLSREELEDPKRLRMPNLSLRSGLLSHVPSQPALFPSRREPGGLLSRDQSLRPDILNPHGTSGNVFAGPSASASTPYAGMLNSWDSDVTGSIPVFASTGKPVAEIGDRSQDTILTPRFLQRPSAKNTFNSMGLRPFLAILI